MRHTQSINKIEMPKNVRMMFTEIHIKELANQFKQSFPQGEYPRYKDLLKWLHHKNLPNAKSIWKYAQGCNT